MQETQKITSNAKINPATKIIYPDNNNLNLDSSIEKSEQTINSTSSENKVPKNFREKIIKFIKLDDLIREKPFLIKKK
jgi:hypothetical protein